MKVFDFMPYFAKEMRNALILLVVVSLFACLSFVYSRNASVNTSSQLSVAFYNLENLYDIIDDSTHNDDDFTENGQYKWSKSRFNDKILNLSKVISQMIDGEAPDVLGVCELESASAFSQLLSSKSLKNQYGFVHYNSPDERGVDVAFAYKTSSVKVLSSQNYPVKLSLDSNDKTRDILWVKTLSLKNNDTIHFIICHFPSRRGGLAASSQNRADAANTCLKIIKEKIQPKSQNLVIMGDFNDQPWDSSMMKILGAHSVNKYPDADLINLMFELPDKNSGSYCFRGQWERIDQIIISHALRNGSGTDYLPGSVNVFKKDWMLQSGKYKGQPFRNFSGSQWLNGYSDHLPVSIKLHSIN
ncbi:MAG: endonuclease/exonuclease/phosphatase family protein [Chitinophagaceae bacterium]